MDGEGSIAGLKHRGRHLGEGSPLKVFMMQSGCSSQILPMSKVLIPEPGPRPASGSSGSPQAVKALCLVMQCNQD